MKKVKKRRTNMQISSDLGIYKNVECQFIEI